MTAKLAAGLILVFVSASSVRASDMGYFNCLHLLDEQREWFASNGVKHCCDLSDGMPSYSEDRADGVYVPPYREAYKIAWSCKMNESWSGVPPGGDHSDWVRVADVAILRKENPVGIVVVWWINPGGRISRGVRCLAALTKG